MTALAKHQEIIKHMLGMNSKNRQEWGGRNYFATYTDGQDYPTLCNMVSIGLVSKGVVSSGGMHYFHVTDAGIAAVGMERARNGYLRDLQKRVA
jgi:DNA-binding PadR family transcriptional regulator